MHDPRIGRFFAVDPLAREYPYYSPYAFSENRVIYGVELEGLEYYPVNPTKALYAIAEGFRLYGDAFFSLFTVEVKPIKVTNATEIASFTTHNITSSTKVSKESGFLIKFDLSEVLDYSGNNNFVMPKDPIKVGPYVEPTSVSTEVQVNLPTQVPTTLSYEHKEKADGSSSDKAEVSVGVDRGNVAAKAYISQEKSTEIVPVQLILLLKQMCLYTRV